MLQRLRDLHHDDFSDPPASLPVSMMLKQRSLVEYPRFVADMTDLQRTVAAFASARDWEKFHTPKNLSMALAGEVGELLAEMQWLSGSEIDDAFRADPEFRQRVCDELADVTIYLTRLHDVLGVDPVANAMDKVLRNESRYPVASARGRATKHTRLDTA